MRKLDDKYLYLPEQFWSKHELCFALIGQIEEFVTSDAYKKLKYNSFSLEGEHDLPEENENILDFLLRTGRQAEHDIAVKSNLIHALTIDTCYFLQEALSCSKKMRLSVAFSLLRKPFVYNLIVLLRMIYEDDFLTKFNNDESFDSTFITKEKKQELIGLSLKNSLSLNEESKDLIFDFIFNKENGGSILNMSEKALHLSTTRNRHNKSGKKNMNFIFSTYNDNVEMWKHLYSKLPLLILYLVEIFDSLILPIVNIEKELLNERLLKRAELFNNAH